MWKLLLFSLIAAIPVGPVNAFQEETLSTQHAMSSNLKIVCEAFNISLENCKCEKFFSGNTSYCDFQKKIEKPTAQLIYRPEISIPIGIISCLFSIFGIIGNAAVISVTKRKTDAWNFYLLIRLLAISDLFFSIMQLLLAIPSFWTNKWVYGEVLCKGFKGGKATGDFLYIGFVILLALERYFAVVKSMKKVSKCKLYIGAIINLVVSLTTALPIFIVFKLDDVGRCEEKWKNGIEDSITYNWLVLALFMFLPIFFLILVCSKIYEKVKVQMNMSRIDVTQLHTSIDRKAKENQRNLKIIVAMVSAYFLCNLPIRIACIYLGYENHSIDNYSYVIITFISMTMYPLLVCINPIIYSLVDNTWRQGIKNELLCCKPGKSEVDDDKGFTIKNKNFDATAVVNVHGKKPERTRNLSIDQGTHLLSYNPSYFTMPNKKGVTA